MSDDMDEGSAAPKYTRDDLDKVGTKWIERIRASEKREDRWRKAAEIAERAYTCDDTEGDVPEFNILHSNVETIVPSIYNSTPVPDIRPRNITKKKEPQQEPQASPQGMPGMPPQSPQGMPPMQMPQAPQPMGRYEIDKFVSELYERVIALQIDDNALDAEIERAAQDAFAAGRGVVRIKFDADVDDAEQPSKERLIFENVSWRDYREGPAKRWRDVPWVAYRHCISQEELDEIEDPELADVYAENGIETAAEETDVDIWEIWCKETKRVYFIVDDTNKVLSVKDDPLKLTKFFPQGEPVQPITATGKRIPVCPYSVYKVLAEELDRATTRINAITKGLKVRGAISADAADLEEFARASDNTITVVANLENLAATGGLEKAIMWWPVDQAIAVLQQLYLQRDQTKQAIYEITGISDIVRGASNAQETLGAQQIKTQWGSLRIKKMQRLIERQVRDIFVISAEIISQLFSVETLQEMTGLEIPQEAMAMLQSPLDHYRINVESDSTIRADVSKNRKEMSDFLQGTAQFFGTLAPLVQQSPGAAEPVAEIYGAFSRQFNLGKSSEDAIENLVEMAKQAGKKPPPNPEIEAKKAEMGMKQQEIQGNAQAKGAELKLKEAEISGKMQLEQAKLQIEREKLQLDRESKQADYRMKTDETLGKMTEGGDALKGMVSEAVAAAMAEVSAGNQQLAGMMMQIAQMVQQGNSEIVAAMTAPKELIRDEAGRPVGVKTVLGDARVIN